MKTDALTLAAVLFVVGLLLTSLVGSDLFAAEVEAPAPLQQGLMTDQ